MNRDLANLYLGKLATGYRVQEYTAEDLGAGVPNILAPFNANRVLLFVNTISTNQLQIKTPSGSFMSWPNDVNIAGHRVYLVTLKDHLILPTLEWWVADANAISTFAMGVIKL